VRSAVGIEVKRLRDPAVLPEVELRLTGDASHAGTKRKRKVNDTMAGSVFLLFWLAGFGPGS